MKIRVLGCSGAELPGRNAPSFLLDQDIVFDAGSLTNVLDLSSQMKITRIFITHAHLDHVKGILFLADNLAVSNFNHQVNVFSISPVLATLKKYLLNNSLWPDFTSIPHPADAILNLVKLKEGIPLVVNGYTITPYCVRHTVPAVGYLVESRSRKRFFYTGDMGPSGETWRKLGDKKIDCLIIDVSFPNRMSELAKKTGHLSPILLKAELLAMHHVPERIFATHPKPQHLETIHQELAELGIKQLTLLNDGDIITV